MSKCTRRSTHHSGCECWETARNEEVLLLRKTISGAIVDLAASEAGARADGWPGMADDLREVRHRLLAVMDKTRDTPAVLLAESSDECAQCGGKGMVVGSTHTAVCDCQYAKQFAGGFKTCSCTSPQPRADAPFCMLCNLLIPARNQQGEAKK